MAPVAGQHEPLLHTPAPEDAGAISPDGRWIAYSSTEGVSSRRQIFVQSFPPGGGKWKITDSGGTYPVWARSTHELFFLGDDGRIRAASYRVEGQAFVAEKPRVWSQAPVPIADEGFDMASDGRRAIIVRPGKEKEHPVRRLTFILNFPEHLRRLTPVRK